ncbi:MAG TPA: FAD-dependent oxidoreductase [Methylomirabilota bacterium]|nr:FAD-dependent oxidoreductase [Methylomirabilota bacterium]
MTATARVVVIGGGIVGTSVLYHLARAGWREVVLLERAELASGSTWHAAGNTPHFNTSLALSRMHLASTELYARLEAETGQPVGFHRPGSLRLASVPDRMDEYRRHRGKARTIGLPFEVVGPEEVRRLHPLVEPRGLLGAAWNPADGHVDPSSVTRALARGAQARGARVERHSRVTALGRTPGGEWRVATEGGEIRAEAVVIAAGTWAREVGQLAGVDLPIVAMEHQYLVTGPVPEIAGLDRELPLLREVDVSYYLRQEGPGLLLGPYERGARPFGVGGIPKDFGADLLPPDPDRLRPIVEGAIARVPVLGRAPVIRIVNGPITYTPDGNPLLGPAFGVRGLWLACGFSFGITQAGGAGQYLAEWIVEGQPSIDLWEVDPRRYGEYATERYAVARCIDIYEDEYAIVYPQDDRRAGRPARTSPLYDRQRAAGAVFGVRNGWEQPYWFAPPGTEARDRPSFRRANWFRAVGDEVRAVRERVGLLDRSSLAKYEVHGPGAAAFLDRLAANRLPAVGAIVRTPLLTARGTVECDVTLTRLAPDRFLVVSAAVAERHDLEWLRRHAPEDGRVTIDDVTARWGVLVVAGPRARAVLARLTDADLGAAAFPWLAAREIPVAFTRVRALRINCVGELGWELHHPIDAQVGLDDALRAAGAEWGIADVGLRAMDSLRLEKGYRLWGADLNTEVTALEGGLEALVAFDKGEFVGRAALLGQRAAGVRHRLAMLEVDAADADCWGNEAVWAGGRVVGITTSGGFGHSLGRSLAIAYLEAAAAGVGTPLAVEILGDRRPARVIAEPPYDPADRRPRS